MGATNVYRVLGPMPFAITLFIDVIKGMTAVLASAVVFKTPLSFFIAAAAAILGHSLSFWVRFRGGKGVATGLGVFLAIAPKAAVACLAVFIVVLLLSRMVSLGSIAAAFALPFLTVYFRDCKAYTPYTAAFAAAAACFVIWRHKANIGRIIRGTENKLGVKNKS